MIQQQIRFKKNIYLEQIEEYPSDGNLLFKQQTNLFEENFNKKIRSKP